MWLYRCAALLDRWSEGFDSDGPGERVCVLVFASPRADGLDYIVVAQLQYETGDGAKVGGCYRKRGGEVLEGESASGAFLRVFEVFLFK